MENNLKKDQVKIWHLMGVTGYLHKDTLENNNSCQQRLCKKNAS